jgi:hypothetical protein
MVNTGNKAVMTRICKALLLRIILWISQYGSWFARLQYPRAQATQRRAVCPQRQPAVMGTGSGSRGTVNGKNAGQIRQFGSSWTRLRQADRLCGCLRASVLCCTCVVSSDTAG